MERARARDGQYNCLQLDCPKCLKKTTSTSLHSPLIHLVVVVHYTKLYPQFATALVEEFEDLLEKQVFFTATNQERASPE